jgi:diguanylate cyclase (GGDEF)-like protein
LYQIVIESRDITERKSEREKYKHLAFHDALTGVPNRRLFIELVEKTLQECRSNGKTGSIMYLDLDEFKVINDTFGHDVGDIVLTEFTKRVRGCLRRVDTLARMGGDEFTILLPHTDKMSAERIAKRILQTFHDPFHIHGHTIAISSSIGISLYPKQGEKAEQLIKVADIALYKAKQNGRNQIYMSD